MYYDKSTFPIYLYPIDVTLFESENFQEKISFIANQENFYKVFLEHLKNKKEQDLLGYLIASLPSLIFSKKNSFSNRETVSKSIKNQYLVYDIINIRIDLNSIKERLSELESQTCVEKVNIDLIISELILFTFQYIFINISKHILSSFNNKIESHFDIKKDSKKYYKYIVKKEKIPMDRAIAQKNFTNSYLESFAVQSEEDRKIKENDLIFMSSLVNQKRRLNSIFENNIIFSEKLSSTKKNSLSIYFFKNFTAKFFFKNLNENSIKDYEVIEAFRAFKKMSQI